MKEDTGVGLKKRVVEESRSALDEVLRKGARELLQAAIEGEVVLPSLTVVILHLTVWYDRTCGSCW